MKKKRELLFSVTAADCKWDYYRCSGPGGQNVNKRETGVRCTHKASGAIGQSCDERHQRRNREIAFERMANTKEFKTWHRMEVARRVGTLEKIERNVDREMRRIKIEARIDEIWTEVDKDDPLNDQERENVK